MKRRHVIPCLAGGIPCLLPAQGDGGPGSPVVRIFLDPGTPSNSYGEMTGMPFRFPVGLGRNGITPAGKSFRGGSSLLGKFRINAILSQRRFEMEEELIRESGKTADWLRANLFRNMSSIDFDGDGKGGEYGKVFIGLAPIDSEAGHPFHFGEYKGTFRWYSYAMHGTRDPSRIGKRSSGGCVNVGESDLARLAEILKVGDLITVEELSVKD